MEILSSRDFDDVNWQKYFEFSQEIMKRYYPDTYKAGNTIEHFRNVLKGNQKNDPTSMDFVVFDSGNPIAWYDLSTWGNEFYFVFDVLSDGIGDDVLKVILSNINELMIEKGFSEAFNFSYRQAINNCFRRINAVLQEELMISSLYRENMETGFYNSIVHNNILNSWKLEYVNEVPDSYFVHFVESVNSYLADMASLNPFDTKIKPIPPDKWKKSFNIHKKNGVTFQTLIIFDSDNKIAGLCYVCIDSTHKEVIRHNGGLTAVTPKYRGMGISKFLKAKQYLKLLKENSDFKYLTTDTMPWNKYMYKINEEFGFKPYKKGACFKLTNEFINNYIKD